MTIVAQARNSQEFHRRRAEAEMEKAITATKPSIALLHLDLARRHREMRKQLVAGKRGKPSAPSLRSINGTDKEG